MGEKDLTINKLLENKDRFADLCNGTVFDGEQVIRPEDLTRLTDRAGIRYVDQKSCRQALQRTHDIHMMASAGLVLAVFAAENQDAVHYAMPVRMMMMDALDYVDQIQRLEDEHKKKGDKLTGSEFLSGIRKSDRLIPVINLVLYWGKMPWDGGTSLYDMLDIPEDNPYRSALMNYLPDYRINLIDVGSIEHPEYFKTSLQQVFAMVKLKSDKEALSRYVREHREELRALDRDSNTALAVLMGEQKRLLAIMEKHREEEGFDMCQAIDELIADGEKRGKKLGEKLGEKRGEKRGETRLSELIATLIKSGRIDLVEKAVASERVRRRLYKEYGI